MTGAEELSARLRAAEQSAWVQAIRAARGTIDRDRQLALVRNSLSWRLTRPLRAASRFWWRGPGALLAGARMAARTLVRGGPAALARKLTGRGRDTTDFVPAGTTWTGVAMLDSSPRAVPPFGGRVLLVAELGLPQCAKYRVRQKREMIAGLGLNCTIVDWRRHDEALSALQLHDTAIFYRVPATPLTLDLIAEAKRLQVALRWEIDDLVFDRALYKTNGNLATLDPALRRQVLGDVPGFRAAMLACGAGIASTEPVAAAMRAAGLGDVAVVENALDRETLAIAEQLRATPRDERDGIVIAYGSGTLTHDEDFRQAAPALLDVMRERPDTRLRIIGTLALDPAFDAFADRVERLPPAGFADYMARLAETDIALAPLEPTPFSEAKSDIKFLEAAVLGLPCVCSPRAAFAAAVVDGLTGFLADDDAAWRRALLALADDPALRRHVGEAARRDVIARRTTASVAERAIRPLLRPLDRPRSSALRVLIVNLFFAPRSYGGATIVAEEMAARLHASDDCAVTVFTSWTHADAPAYALRRYEAACVPVVAVNLPGHDSVLDFDDPLATRAFAETLDAVRPDVVHFHAVQRFGAGLARACLDRSVPYVITLHDAWWLCGRQFMVRGDGAYCAQTRIEIDACQRCIPDALHLRQRWDLLTHALLRAALVLSPSEPHLRLHLANGLDPGRARVHPNGIRPPSRPRRRVPGDHVRFGYVGGPAPLKGYRVLRDAFAAVASADYELLLIDAGRKIGAERIDISGWRARGRIRVVPPYAQDGIDDFFDAIDVLLFPSQWKESFGLTVVEALARDVWVVASAGGGAEAFIEHGINGTLIPMTPDPAPLRAAIESLIRDPARLRAHRNTLKDRIVTYDHQAEELFGLLRSCERSSTSFREHPPPSASPPPPP